MKLIVITVIALAIPTIAQAAENAPRNATPIIVAQGFGSTGMDGNYPPPRRIPQCRTHCVPDGRGGMVCTQICM